ncbi:hypothetical protein [Streptomyces sp. NPDC015130]|uniref:hypothetical protein n=1 Tax=Streptomyces sp. NPDC015130 TaxID=3364940 RepID=UPI0036F8E19D
MPNDEKPRYSDAGGAQSYDISVVTFLGQRALVVQPAIPDSAPAMFKNGLAIRRAANLHGQCPDCEARPQMPNREERRALNRAGEAAQAIFCHEEWCGCLTDDEGGAV